jgi:hypothetical protein
MRSANQVSRRRIIGAGLWGGLLLATGAVIGWITGRSRYARGIPSPSPSRQLDQRFRLDLGKHTKTDPELLLYAEAGGFKTGLQRVRRLSVGADGRVYVAGDKVVRVFQPDGRLATEIPLADRPYCVSASAERIYVGLRDSIQVMDLAGERLTSWPVPPPQGSASRKHKPVTVITGIAVLRDAILVADAGNRRVVKYGLDGERLLSFGGKNADAPGLAIPSPYFDIEADQDGTIYVNNPGRHRIESYSPSGRYLSGWGRPSLAIDGFCGCCNPVALERLTGGEFITSEKGLARVKVYDANGTFKGVVAGPEQLLDTELMRDAGENPTIGVGFDVAAVPDGQVLILDPYRRSVRRFKPIRSRDPV